MCVGADAFVLPRVFVVFSVRWAMPNDVFGLYLLHGDRWFQPVVPFCAAVFIYMCPEGCKVKLRMVYSTTKASVITHASEVGLELAAKVLQP